MWQANIFLKNFSKKNVRFFLAFFASKTWPRQIYMQIRRIRGSCTKKKLKKNEGKEIDLTKIDKSKSAYFFTRRKKATNNAFYFGARAWVWIYTVCANIVWRDTWYANKEAVGGWLRRANRSLDVNYSQEDRELEGRFLYSDSEESRSALKMHWQLCINSLSILKPLVLFGTIARTMHFTLSQYSTNVQFALPLCICR